MPKRFRVLALLILAVNASSAGAETDLAYWSETGIGFDAVRELLSNSNCRKAEHVLPCTAALDVIGRAQGLGRVTDPKLIDWDRLSSDLLSRPPAGGETLIAAAAFNAYVGLLLDPHSRLEPWARYLDARDGHASSFGGIGVKFRVVGGRFLIAQPLSKSPAYVAGLWAGDEVIAVDGAPVARIAFNELVGKIRGEVGSTVRLEIRRDGSPDPIEVSIVRAVIAADKVTAALRTMAGRRIGTVGLEDFRATTTCDRVAESVRTLERQGAEGIVLDLRGNPGGSMEQAICVAALFIGPDRVISGSKYLNHGKEGPMVHHSASFALGQVDISTGGGNNEWSVKTPDVDGLPVTRLPVVALIDAASASSAEIVAGALQDDGLSSRRDFWVAGDRSYGKATVQESAEPIDLPGLIGNEKIKYSRTTERFYEPSGRTSQGRGLSPDFPFDVAPDATADEKAFVREEDEFPNALSAQGMPWTQPRLGAVQALQSCAAHGEAKAIYEAGRHEQIRPDYPLLATGDVFACLLSKTLVAELIQSK